MSKLEVDNGARILAIALLAAFAVDVVGSGIQLAVGVDTFGSRVNVIYAASSVRPSEVLLLAVGLVVLALRPDRGVLRAYTVVAVLAAVIAVVGLVLLPGMPDALRRAQVWSFAGSLAGGGLLAVAVAVLSARLGRASVGTASEPGGGWSN